MTYLSDEEFYFVYSKVPRLTLDVLIEGEQGIVLTCRSIQPYLGEWHIPGGTMYKDETVYDAAVRIAKKETGLDIIPRKSIGHMEFPNEIREKGTMHTISIVILAKSIGGVLKKDIDSSGVDWFLTLPEKVIKQHKLFLAEHLKAS